MSNLILFDDQEATGKVNIDELYEKNMKRNLKQLSIFNKILNRVHRRIQLSSRTTRNDKYIWSIIPEFIFGEPTYDQGDCIAHVVGKLVDNGFHVRYIHPNTLFISWENWVPTYVRNEIKKKTGKTINEKGQVIETKDKETTDESSSMTPDERLLSGNENTNVKAKYTPINKYKPTGHLVYNPDIFDKIQGRTT
jgi:hypothetical protein